MATREPSRRTRSLLRSLIVCAALSACDGSGSLDAERASVPKQAGFVAAAKGRVDIEGGLIRLAARRDGIVERVMVEEGDQVRAGQVIAQLDNQQARLGVELARAEVFQAQKAVGTTRQKLASAEREERRLAPLAEERIVPAQEHDRARDEVLIAKSELGSAEAGVEVAASRLRSAESEIEQRIVRAPLDGQIVRRQARPGDGVSTLNVTPLFLFAPNAQRIVRAELEERFLAQVLPGQSAEVLLEADETQTFEAKILRLGRVVGARTPSDDPSEKSDLRVVECVLSIDAPNLLIGQRVIVRVRPQEVKR